jgi:general stress protein YciG
MKDNQTRDRPVIDWVSALVQKPSRMAELGRKGGLKGGKARAANLSPARLSAIGRKGATARWGKPV